MFGWNDEIETESSLQFHTKFTLLRESNIYQLKRKACLYQSLLRVFVLFDVIRDSFNRSF